MQHWHVFFSFAHVWHTTVLLKRAFAPGFQRKIENGRSHTLQPPPNCSRDMRTYGLSPRQFSQRMGNSLSSQPTLFPSDLIPPSFAIAQ